MQRYTAKNFDLGDLEGLSKEQIDVHLGLYAGYVKNVNTILDKLEEYGQDEEGNKVAISELRRRFGFEFNGMRLHEYYFDQFVQGEDGMQNGLKEKLAEFYGSYEAWEADFRKIGKLRGIGWTLLVQDEVEGNLFNIWVSDHEIGHLGGQKVICAMDMWEHAFMVDYKPAQKGDYIDAFFKNLNWNVVEGRYQK